MQQAITGIITLPAVLQGAQSGTAGQHFTVSLSNVKSILKIKDYKKDTKVTRVLNFLTARKENL